MFSICENTDLPSSALGKAGPWPSATLNFLYRALFGKFLKGLTSHNSAVVPSEDQLFSVNMG